MKEKPNQVHSHFAVIIVLQKFTWNKNSCPRWLL